MRLQTTTIAAAFATLLAAIPQAAPACAARRRRAREARIHTLTDAQRAAEALAWDASGRIVAVGLR